MRIFSMGKPFYKSFHWNFAFFVLFYLRSYPIVCYRALYYIVAMSRFRNVGVSIHYYKFYPFATRLWKAKNFINAIGISCFVKQKFCYHRHGIVFASNTFCPAFSMFLNIRNIKTFPKILLYNCSVIFLGMWPADTERLIFFGLRQVNSFNAGITAMIHFHQNVPP